MSKVIKNYIPNVSVSFTFIMIILAVCNMLYHRSVVNINSVLILQLIGLLILLITIDVFVWKYRFKKNINGYLVSGLVQCVVYLIYGVVCYWFKIHPLVLLDKVIVFITIYACICVYYYNLRKREADEINRLLQQNR